MLTAAGGSVPIQLGTPLACGGASTIAKQPAEHGDNVRRNFHGRPVKPRHRSRSAIRIEPPTNRFPLPSSTARMSALVATSTR